MRAELLQPGRHLRRPLTVAADEGLDGLVVGQVETALAGQQELAADRGHGVVEIDHQAGRQQALGGHQPGGAAANDGDMAGRRRNRGGCGASN